MSEHPKPEITKDFFEVISDESKFQEKYSQQINYLCYKFGLRPLIISVARTKDVCVAYNHDKANAYKYLPDNSRGPDHFKLVGILVFWLRRFAPVYDTAHTIRRTLTKPSKSGTKLFRNC